MSILQLSRITHRKGLHENLPQLSGAEFGWAIDSKRLYIGNGTLSEGAPIIGNTEILTEFSDVLALSGKYTYKGEQAGYVVQTGDQEDILRTLQQKFDETVSVKDVGAVGDNTTDDTDAINRALYELFCREVNPEIRRSLYFPAGVYVVSNAIKIPTYAKVYGDGLNSSIIEYRNDLGATPVAHVITTVDSLFQDGPNVGNNSAVKPINIEMSNMSIHTTTHNSLLALNSVEDSTFSYMEFKYTQPNALELNSNLSNTSAIDVMNFNASITSNIQFDKCITYGTSYGMRVNHVCKGLTFENGRMEWHFEGANIGTEPFGVGPSGINITRTIFDNIFDHGINIGTKLNSSAFNVFYNVGNNFSSSPITSVINLGSADNISIGDLFERPDEHNFYPHYRIELNGTSSIAFDSASAIKLGSFERKSGINAVLTSNVLDENLLSMTPLRTNTMSSFKIDYIATQGQNIRNGVLTVTNNATNVSYNDEYNESGIVKLNLDAVASSGNVQTTLLNYSTETAPSTDFRYSITRLD